MHCIQGSDAHKLESDPKFKNEMGVGERATEILIDEISFDEIKQVFLGNDFSRTRPYRPSTEEPFDPIREAREQGDTLVQAFHDRMYDKRNIAPAILHDVVALANTNGGTVYIGANSHARQPVVGIERADHAISDLRSAISKQITPPLEVQIEVLKSQGKSVLQMIVPRGSDVPYALDGAYIYVRSENETNLAMRDEIVQLVRESLAVEFAASPVSEPLPPPEETTPATAIPSIPAPRTGVEIVSFDVRKGVHYYSVRDLRNNRIVQNVTLASARSLWQYAISENEKNPVKSETIQWHGEVGITKIHKRGGKTRYDLAQRVGEKILVYYGVTDDGMDGEWRKLVEGETNGEQNLDEGEIEVQEVGTPTAIAVEDESFAESTAPIDLEPPAEMIPPPVISDELAESYVSPEPSEEREPEIPVSLGEYDEFHTPIGEPLPSDLDYEPGQESVADELPSAPVVELPVEIGDLPIAPALELNAAESETAPEPESPPEPTPPPAAPKTRAQTWREALDRAMAEVRARQSQGQPPKQD
jgi:hypothetical protein